MGLPAFIAIVLSLVGFGLARNPLGVPVALLVGATVPAVVLVAIHFRDWRFGVLAIWYVTIAANSFIGPYNAWRVHKRRGPMRHVVGELGRAIFPLMIASGYMHWRDSTPLWYALPTDARFGLSMWLIWPTIDARGAGHARQTRAAA